MVEGTDADDYYGDRITEATPAQLEHARPHAVGDRSARTHSHAREGTTRPVTRYALTTLAASAVLPDVPAAGPRPAARRRCCSGSSPPSWFSPRSAC